MGLAKIIETPAGTLGIWELIETLEELMEVCELTNADKQALNQFSFEKRKKEFLAVRKLAGLLLTSTPEISYKKSGRPVLKNTNLNISISHSAELVVVLISEKKIGIDAENVNRKIDKVLPRFLNKNEIEFISSSCNQQNFKTLFWSAKEAIYKCADMKEILFNQHIQVDLDPIHKEKTFKGTLTKNNQTLHFKLWSLFYKNNVVVYCVQEEKQ